MTDPRLILQQLYIIRAQVELGIAQIEAGLLPDGAAAVPGACPHPEDKRYDATTGGDSGHKWICGACLQTFEGALP